MHRRAVLRVLHDLSKGDGTKALRSRRWRWSGQHRCWYRFCALDRDKETAFAKALTTSKQEEEAA